MPYARKTIRRSRRKPVKRRLFKRKTSSKKRAPAKRRSLATTLAGIAEVKSCEDGPAAEWQLASSQTGDIPTIIQTRHGVTSEACNIMMPTAFTAMHMGDGPTQVQGQSIYGRGLSMKIRCTFPNGSDTLLGDHPIYLIHGFVRAPMFPQHRASLRIDSNGDGAIEPDEVKFRLPDRGAIEEGQLATYVLGIVREHLDSKADLLDWNEKKQRRGFSTLGFKKIYDPNKSGLQGDSLQNAFAGTNTKYFKLDWPMQRKMQMQMTTGYQTNVYDEGKALYPNYNAIPFACIYNPGWQNQGVVSMDVAPEVSSRGVVSVKHTSKMWFLDC
jgi:hypothetical protein